MPDKTKFPTGLESMGQDQQKLPKDGLIVVLQLIGIALVIELPLFLLIPLAKSQTLSPAGAPTGSALPPAVLAVLIGFVIYLPCALLLTLSYVGGWRRLAALYPAPPNFEAGQLFRFQSCSVGWINYNNILWIRVADAGLLMKCPFPFSFFYPPILIPWTAIKSINEVQLPWRRTSPLFVVGSPKIASFTLRNKELTAAVRSMWKANQ